MLSQPQVSGLLLEPGHAVSAAGQFRSVSLVNLLSFVTLLDEEVAVLSQSLTLS